MPIAFVDLDVLKAFNNLNSDDKSANNLFPAHSFEASCLRVGISLNDLKKRTYVSIMKVLFSFLNTNNSKTREANQIDIDKFMS